MKNKTKTIMSLILAFIVIPAIIVFFLIFGIKEIKNTIARYPESKPKYQEEVIKSLSDENNIIDLTGVILSDFIFTDHKSDAGRYTFRIYDTNFSSRYEFQYNNGLVTEIEGLSENVKTYQSEYHTTDEFMNSIYSLKLDVSDLKVDIDYDKSEFEKNNSIKVIVDMKADSPLILNLKYLNKEITFNDVEILYSYKINDTDKTINMTITGYHDDIKYTFYTSKDIKD